MYYRLSTVYTESLFMMRRFILVGSRFAISFWLFRFHAAFALDVLQSLRYTESPLMRRFILVGSRFAISFWLFRFHAAFALDVLPSLRYTESPLMRKFILV